MKMDTYLFGTVLLVVVLASTERAACERSNQREEAEAAAKQKYREMWQAISDISSIVPKNLPKLIFNSPVTIQATEYLGADADPLSYFKLVF